MNDLKLVQNNSTLVIFTLLVSIVLIITPINLGKIYSSICKLIVIGLLCLILFNNYKIFLNNRNSDKINLTEITLDCTLSFFVVILILMICRALIF